MSSTSSEVNDCIIPTLLKVIQGNNQIFGGKNVLWLKPHKSGKSAFCLVGVHVMVHLYISKYIMITLRV